jgi:hypothetical protein
VKIQEKVKHFYLVIAVYSKIDDLTESIKAFKNKTPHFNPLKIRFFRKFDFQQKKNKKLQDLPKNVLAIKHLPEDLKKDDLRLFLSEFVEPLYIAYIRDQ